jgi:hypothetical protein
MPLCPAVALLPVFFLAFEFKWNKGVMLRIAEQLPELLEMSFGEGFECHSRS